MTLFADESRDSVNVKLEKWWEVLESKGFKLSCTQMEYMIGNLSGDVQINVTPATTEAQEILQRNSFL